LSVGGAKSGSGEGKSWSVDLNPFQRAGIDQPAHHRLASSGVAASSRTVPGALDLR
jgi:hypothetical protein